MKECEFISKAYIQGSGPMLYENTYEGFTYPKHFHETFLIEVIGNGTENFYCQGVNYKNVPKNSLVLINPGEIHTGGGNIANTSLECKVFYPSLDSWKAIAGESFSQMKSSQLLDMQFRSTIISDNEIADNIHRLFHFSKFEEYKLLVDDLYQNIMTHILEKHMSAPVSLDEKFKKYEYQIKRAIEFINDQLSENLLLDQIAKEAYMSQYHFLRVFTKITGLTLHQYILALRIERAKLLLKQTRNINTTYSKVGFLNQSHFTRVFKKIAGLTPGQYLSLDF